MFFNYIGQFVSIQQVIQLYLWICVSKTSYSITLVDLCQ